MAIPKKGTRKIRVNGVMYRWIVSPDDEPGLGIVVELMDSTGCRMITWVEHGNIISPWLVRKAILHALSKGWQPQKTGSDSSYSFEGILEKEADNQDLELFLRSYQEKDRQAVLNLNSQDEVQRGKGTWDDNLRNILRCYQQQGGEFVVGVLNKQIIAIGAYKLISVKEAEVGRIRVHKDFQQQGYGQQLLTYLERQAIQSGVRRLTLFTTSRQVTAQRFFVRNSYVEMRRHPWRTMERIYFEKRIA